MHLKSEVYNDRIHNAMNILNTIIKIINAFFGGINDLLKYKHIFKITGIFLTRRFPKARKNHKYAILVAARNEETVIGNLIDSINNQDYPDELIRVFVVADNCTDNTAAIARELGAVCYERFDNEHRTKGYALQYLVECIRRDYSVESFDGYFIFDADNLLKEDYVTRMNEAFDAGEKIVTSYRNTKNFDDNWIAASYGIHWLRTIRNEHRAKSFFHLATRIQGTGFLFAHELIKDGWKYTSLTEDRAFCADAVVNGYKISYCNAAEFYDEQPVDIKIAMRQRIRWAKGHLQAFVESGGKLFTHIFVTRGTANKTLQSKDGRKLSIGRRIFNNLRLRFMSLDMLSIVYPHSIISVAKKLVVYILRLIVLIISGKTFGAVLTLTWSTLYWTVRTYVSNMLVAAYVMIAEHKHIVKMKWYRKVWYCITFPIFDLIGKLSMCIALFKKVEWKPIPHNSTIDINDIKEGTSGIKKSARRQEERV